MFEPKATAPHLDSTNRVILAVGRPVPVFPGNGHRQADPARPKSADSGHCSIYQMPASWLVVSRRAPRMPEPFLHMNRPWPNSVLRKQGQV